ncbi:MAG: hypothetical protein GX295_11915 [Syntrophomonadaceae bacterium]|nr:hypothetical protein [Syntrophomonadaceae bacterium]
MNNKTKILCLDVDKKIIDFLSKNFDVYNGSLGTKVNVEGVESQNLLLNFDLPANIHEFDFIIDEMDKPALKDYYSDEHKHKEITSDKAYYFYCSYPTTVFDPVPYSCNILSSKLKNKKDRRLINILFHDYFYEIKYFIRNISNVCDTKEYVYSNYSHVNHVYGKRLHGSKVHLCDSKISKILFNGLLNKITYNQIYYHPTIWSGETRVNDENFIPLLKNQNDEIASYIYVSTNDITFMFPQMEVEYKIELLETLFNEILYKHFSEYFPDIEQKKWTENPIYYLPGHSNLLDEDNKLDINYQNNKIEVKRKIEENYNKYSFLHKILTETGDDLVNAIKEYLEWLGFENIVIKDEEAKNGLLEEDIQIKIPGKGLLVIEVKGIGGTSKDAECSQINKIKFRRSKERNKFDVYALYIVNNERHIEPIKRKSPPFNANQQQDAKNEERGLMFTWQLFNLYFNVENGFISKEEARSCFLQYGLVDFTPSSIVNLGKPHKFFQNNKIICIDLNDTEVKVGDFIVYKENGKFRKEEIISIQVEKEEKTSNNNGKTGFELSNSVPNISNAYLLRSEE